MLIDSNERLVDQPGNSQCHAAFSSNIRNDAGIDSGRS